MSFTFTGWPALRLRLNETAFKTYLDDVGRESVKAFKSGMSGSGRKSSAGQYPAIQSGALAGSVSHSVAGDSVEVGSNTHYSPYLRYGTRRMAKRKMSDAALQEGIANARISKQWIKYTGW